MVLTALFLADLHGDLPDPKTLPQTDYLFLGGDLPELGATTLDEMLEEQKAWYTEKLTPWLESLPQDADHIISIAGNHEFLATYPYGDRFLRSLPWTYLRDQSIVLDNGQVLFGSPWSEIHPRYPAWAFQTHESALKNHWEKIPMNCDILLVHGPAYGFGDTIESGEHVGSVSLREMIEKRRFDIHTVLSGHIHEDSGFSYDTKRLYVNGSRNEKGAVASQPAWKIVLEPGAKKAVRVDLPKRRKPIFMPGFDAEVWEDLAAKERGE